MKLVCLSNIIHYLMALIILNCFMQYFHPDNMSSEEKMKIELAKVREEFKMSESDCGSSRVQSKGFTFGFIKRCCSQGTKFLLSFVI